MLPFRFGVVFTGHFDWLEQHLVANPRPLERSVLLFGIGEPADHHPELGHLDPDTLASSPFSLVGDTDQMAEALIERRERWDLSYVVCFDEDMDRLGPVIDALSGH